jgi:N-acetylglucosamine kinase-like BadF-type ATPase
VGEARADGANLYTHGELHVEKVFDAIIETFANDHPIAAACVGIAGVDRPYDEGVIRNILRRLGHRKNVRVVNDAVIALTAGAAERFGIVVLAGTGSIAYGADRAGRTARSGGFGSLLADEGSGYWLGHQALREAVRASDGRGGATRLRDLVFEALGATSMAEVIPKVYEQAMPKHGIAALAPLVERARAEGDTVAAELICRGGQELALAAGAVARALSFGAEPFPVVLAGGAFKACPSLVDTVVGALDLPAARPAPLTVEPALGAVALALEILSR